jgi:iron(III) transport system substrate-binding protein
MSRPFRSVVASASVLLAATLVAAACGSDNSQSNSAAPTTGASATSAAATATSAASATSATSNAAAGTTATSSSGADAAAFQTIIDKAKQEGSVTIYSSQGTDQLNDLAKRFQSKYGVKLDVLRDVDANLEAKLDVEHQSGKGIADVAVLSDTNYVNTKGQAGYFTKATGPDFNNPAYDQSKNVNPNGSFVVSAAVFALGWNTQSVPGGLKSYADLLDPKLKGMVGVPDPAVSPSIVDFYMYLQEQQGADFVTKLAAQQPQIFPSVLTEGQNLTSGQISAATAVQPLVDEKAQGAPVDFLVPSPAWGARFWASVTSVAPHPNAALLLADYLLTTDGQEAVARKAGSALPNIQGAVTDVSKIRVPDPAKLTPDAVAKFRADFKEMTG